MTLTLTNSLKDTSVKYFRNKDNGQDNYGFTTARIEALGGDCETQPYGKSVLLSRVKEIPANAMGGIGQINQQPIDGYYYIYRETIPQCSGSTTDPSASVDQVEIDDREALKELLATLKASE